MHYSNNNLLIGLQVELLLITPVFDYYGINTNRRVLYFLIEVNIYIYV